MRNRSLVLVAVLLAVGPVAFAKSPNGNGVGAGGVPPGQPFQALQAQIDALKSLVSDNLILNHHQELPFTIEPGGSASFPMPKAQSPVRVEVTFSLHNGGVQTPSEVMYAVVNFDATVTQNPQMTWVGTDSDGTTKGCNSLPAPNGGCGPGNVIASICGGTCTTINASLVADPVVDLDNAPNGSLILEQAVNTRDTGYYVVHLWY
jgi:hypothetical protein